MRICNLSDGLSQLSQAATELHERWQQTQQHWNDQASRDFEETHLRPIPAQMQVLIAAVQMLSSTVEKAARELSDRDESVL